MNIKSFILFTGILFTAFLAMAQDYGLRFYGQDYELDKRTSLSLNDDNDFRLKDEFTLSFDIEFVKGYNSYFGYIFRILIEDETNVDFIYENNGFSNTANLIIGDKLPVISVQLSDDYFFDWKKIVLTMNAHEGFIKLQMGDSVYVSNDFKFDQKDEFKVFFGQNQYKRIKSTDLPNMEIRDIKVLESGKLKYNWNLGQMDGTEVFDLLAKKKAVVVNPFWVFQKHLQWKQEWQQDIEGYTQAAVDQEHNVVYFASPDSMYAYSLTNQQLIGKHKIENKLMAERGMYLFFDPLKERVISYFEDEKSVSYYDTILNKWSLSFSQENKGTDFFHNNQFYDRSQNALYILGGYGHLTYKNDIYKVDLNSFAWQLVPHSGHIFTPRYLFGLGKYQHSDTVLIAGGFGSETGDQKINPGYWFDLLKYSPKSGEFKKVYELNNNTFEDFCMARSLVIDEENDAFYGLIFSKYQYEGNLQLVKGSLTMPKFEKLAHPLPFTFHDIMSYVDLIYSEQNQKLYALTLFHDDENHTILKIHSIQFPPAEIPLLKANKKIGKFSLILAIVAFIGLLAGLYFIPKRKSKVVKVNAADTKLPEPDPDTKEEIVEFQQPAFRHSNKNENIKSSIMLFGGFQAIDAAGEDITSQFTPLLKELFLLILLNSIPNRKGISSNKLKELLWFDKSEKDARNNQAVNIARLKGLMKRMGDIEISKKTGYWKAELLSDAVFIDYKIYTDIVDQKNIKQAAIEQLIEITKSGALLINQEYEWLDEYKSEVSNNITDALIQFAENNKTSVEPNFLIHIADVVFHFDSLNEEAMILKCRTLGKLGKHNLAKNTYTHFVNEYKLLYNEEYSEKFNDILE